MTAPRRTRTRPIVAATIALGVLAVLAGCDADSDGSVASETTVPDSATTVTPPTSASGAVTTPSSSADASPPPALDTVPDLSVAPDDVPPTPAGGTLFAPGDVDAALDPWIALAADDLAARLGIAAAEIETSSAVLVIWPDTSLGCPAPGMAYATVLTDGAVIELAAGGDVYRYHAGGSASPFLCDVSLAVAPARLPG